MKSFKQFLKENQEKEDYVIFPGEHSSMSASSMGLMYKGKMYVLSIDRLKLMVKFTFRQSKEAIQQFLDYNPPEAPNPAQFSIIRDYELPIFRMIDIRDISVYLFEGELREAVDNQSWHIKKIESPLNPNEEKFLKSKILHNFTDYLQNRFDGICNGSISLDSQNPYKQITKGEFSTNKMLEFRQMMKAVINKIKDIISKKNENI
jgi:hypothetical protein